MPDSDNTEAAETVAPTLEPATETVDLAKLQAELEQARANLVTAVAAKKAANDESAGRRIKIYKLQDERTAAFAQRDEALATSEKLASELAALQTRAAFRNEARTQELNWASEAAAKTAFSLLDLSGVNGDNEGLAEAIKALAEAHPYLLKRAASAPPTDAASKSTAAPRETTDAYKKEMFDRLGVIVE